MEGSLFNPTNHQAQADTVVRQHKRKLGPAAPSCTSSSDNRALAARPLRLGFLPRRIAAAVRRRRAARAARRGT
eukprot:1363822-Prymnesium_polylepis.1